MIRLPGMILSAAMAAGPWRRTLWGFTSAGRLRLAGALLVILLLAGCGAVPVVAPPPDPVPAQCDPRCFEACDVLVPAWRPVDPDSPEAWDELPGQVLIPARRRLWNCEGHRQACVQCLDRLRDAGVIR